MTIELFKGNLLDISKEADLSTALSAKEILTKRRNDESLDGENLRNTWMWTGDFSMYRVENGKVLLYLAPTAQNLVFQNIEDAYCQFTKNRDYNPTKEGIAKIMDSAKSGETFVCDLSKLNLKEHNDEWVYFSIDDAKKGKQRELRNRVYDDEDVNLLKGKGTKFFVLNPKYVLQNVKDNESAVGRVSFLDGWLDGCNFVARGRDAGDDGGRLVGVRRSERVAESDERVFARDNFSEAYKTIISNPDKVTSEMVSGLSNLIASYLTRQAK